MREEGGSRRFPLLHFFRLGLAERDGEERDAPAVREND